MLTVKQIADNAGVSKTTVKRHLKRIEDTNGAEYIRQNVQTEPNGVILISEELAKQLHDNITRPERTATQDCNAPQHIPEHIPERTATCTGTDRNAPERIQERTATHTETERNTGTQTANHDTIAALNEIINTLKAQLKQQEQRAEQDRADYKAQLSISEQDKADLKEQLAAKDKQIEQLNNSLIQITTTLSQQQALHMEHIKQLPAAEDPGAEEQKKKKGLFSLFRRK